MSDEEVIEMTVDIAELKKMKVADLKRKLGELGLETKGTKSELIARVEKYLSEQDEEVEDLLEEDEEEEETEEAIDELVGESELTEPSGGGGEKPANELDSEQVEEKSAECVAAEQTESVSVVSSGVAVGEPDHELKEKVTKVSLTGLSAADRLAKRAERFGGNTSLEAKKIARAERFGTSLENGVYKGLGKRPLSEEEMERLRKRGERFGSSVSPAIAKVEDEERKKKRIEKFGLTTIELSEEDRKKKRAEKFGT